MKKLSLLTLLVVGLILGGCGSSEKEDSQTRNDQTTPQLTAAVDICEKYLNLVECVLSTQEEDQQAYMDTIKASVNSYTEPQKQEYCAEQWEQFLELSEIYAGLGCPME